MELLILADGLAERTRRAEELRALQQATAETDVQPEITDYSDFDRSQDEDVDFDYSAVDWDEAASPDEWRQIQAALSQDRVEVGTEEQVGTEDAPPVPDVDFDREWT